MPIYEFHSPDSGKIYSFYAPSSKYSDAIPICPDGKNNKMVKLLSGFSITGKKEELPDLASESDSDDPFAGMEPCHANQMMKELEHSIAGIDEDNPDPKQMGSLMRKMCDFSGEGMDEPMEEVVRKLEEGMNPEELEERMGELMGDEDSGEHAKPSDNSEESTQTKLKRLLMKKPRRDPTLYEIKDYLRQK